MTSRESGAEWARVFGEEEVVPDATTEQLVQISRLIEAPAMAPARLSVRPSAYVLGAGALLAAAGALLVATRMTGPTPAALAEALGGRAVTASPSGETGTLAPGAVLASGSQIAAEQGFRLEFVRGAQARAEQVSSWTLFREATVEGLRLERGSVLLQVDKKELGQSFEIRTATTTVTVVGTEFRVWLADDGGAAITCVEVLEGRVLARSSAHEAVLERGERFSSAPQSRVCEPEAGSGESAPARGPGPTADPAAVVDAPALVAAQNQQKPVARTNVPVAAKSSLAIENEFFLRIVHADRQGDTATAARLRKEFLLRFPQSTFAARVRASAGTDR